MKDDVLELLRGALRAMGENTHHHCEEVWLVGRVEQERSEAIVDFGH